MGAHDAFVELSGVMNVLAVSLNKLGNDVRLLGSGPRSGLSELTIPADGLSSSIMPGKTNPTQSEAMTMVCAQVMGNHVAVTFGAAQSFLELNVFKPLIIHNVLQSAGLLADVAESFAHNMVDKLEPARDRIAQNLANSLMLVTALNPRIGYDKAVKIGKKALAENMTLRDAAQALGFVEAGGFRSLGGARRDDRTRRHARRIGAAAEAELQPERAPDQRRAGAGVLGGSGGDRDGAGDCALRAGGGAGRGAVAGGAACIPATGFRVVFSILTVSKDSGGILGPAVKQRRPLVKEKLQ